MREKSYISLPGLAPKILPREEVEKSPYTFSMFSALGFWQDVMNPEEDDESQMLAELLEVGCWIPE